MSEAYNLVISAGPTEWTANLKLFSADDRPLVTRCIDFQQIPYSVLRGFFDLRNYLQFYGAQGDEVRAVKDVGVCIGNLLLGPEIFGYVSAPDSLGTLKITIDKKKEVGNSLLTALLQVPWEIARLAVGESSLAEIGLAIAISVGEDLVCCPLSFPEKQEPLRILFVFAETPFRQPLAARRERRQLLQLFRDEIAPHRRIVAHFLSHWVTREQLQSRIEQSGGYHVVHWSGHGGYDSLELARQDGSIGGVDGRGLLQTLAGSMKAVPQFLFLSACDSGRLLEIRNWADFSAAVQGDSGATDENEGQWFSSLGHTGIAGTLVYGGVPAVLAMRFAVGDEYATDFAVEFYRALFQKDGTFHVAKAFAMAKKRLQQSGGQALRGVSACDPVAPLLFGNLEASGFSAPTTDVFRSKGHQFADDFLPEAHFVGRTREIAALESFAFGAACIKSIAVISGLAGMGKTAIVREILDLWNDRFDLVVIHQSRDPTSLESLLRDIHFKLLSAESQSYVRQIQERPSEAIYLGDVAGGDAGLNLERLAENLVQVLRTHRVLLILDNFETNLRSEPESNSAWVGWASLEPAWDRFFSALTKGLENALSRILITSRRPIAALGGDYVHQIRLGPLPASEAVLYLRENPGLRRMFLGGTEEDRLLAIRTLEASRFHPLLMDRLAKLATSPELRPKLFDSLAALEGGNRQATLPELFSEHSGVPNELRYLEDALVSTIESLIEWATPDARLLLWFISLGGQPSRISLLEKLWSTMIKRPWETSLDYLMRGGLISEHGQYRLRGNSRLVSIHELVRERIDQWMKVHPKDMSQFTVANVRSAYGRILEDVFHTFTRPEEALPFGVRALVHYMNAGDWKPLSLFADDVITATRDPVQLKSLVSILEMGVASAPEGQVRWNCICSLANTLRNIGHLTECIPIYRRAEKMAATAAVDDGSNKLWGDVARINSSMGIALRRSGLLNEARKCYDAAIAASGRAGRPAVFVASYELEILRLDVEAGKADEVVTRIESRLERIRGWWRSYLAGSVCPEAPDPEFLERVMIGALDVAHVAESARKNPATALQYLDETLTIRYLRKHPKPQIAIDKFNRAKLLVVSGVRLGEAQKDLEECVVSFRSKPEWLAKIYATFADLLMHLGDIDQAIVQQRRAIAIVRELPDISDRGCCHLSIAQFLKVAGDSASKTEATFHQLAALIYFRIAPLDRHLTNCLCHYFEDFLQCMAEGHALVVPELSAMLGKDDFRQLDAWLVERGVDRVELEEEIRDLLHQADSAALQSRVTTDTSSI